MQIYKIIRTVDGFFIEQHLPIFPSLPIICLQILKLLLVVKVENKLVYLLGI